MCSIGSALLENALLATSALGEHISAPRLVILRPRIPRQTGAEFRMQVLERVSEFLMSPSPATQSVVFGYTPETAQNPRLSRPLCA